MTLSHYLMARVARAFGFTARTKRLTEAASENALLEEAEFMLGKKIWERTEKVEELGFEYWSLRKLTAKLGDLRATLAEDEKTLEDAYEQRAEILNEKSDKQMELEEQRANLIKVLEEMSGKRDLIISEARRVRRQYEGLKTKLLVISGENLVGENEEELHDTRTRMEGIREQFHSLKTKRDEIMEDLALREQEIEKIDKAIGVERNKQRDKASAGFQIIGDINRRISTTKAAIGAVEAQMNQHYGDIGHYVSLHYKANREVGKAMKSEKSMLDVMAALRMSIHYNQQLTSIS